MNLPGSPPPPAQAGVTPAFAHGGPVAEPLPVLAAIAERLASAAVPEEVIGEILDIVARATGAAECALWLTVPGGVARGWSSGASSLADGDVLLAIRHSEEGSADLRRRLAAGGTLVHRLASAGRLLGALTLVTADGFTPPATTRLLLETLGNMLAPILAHAEYSHRLEEEVRLRTRQIDEERRFTERIIDSLPVGLYVIDRDYRIQAWNRKRETGMQGIAREEAIGRTIYEILHRQPAEVLHREFDEVFRTGRMQQFQTQSEATGELRTYRISKIPMRLSDQQVTHVITIGEDVTEWKEAERRFSQAEKLAAIGQLAAGVMHEINNPLATIAACAESLQLRLEDQATAGAPPLPDASDLLRIVDNEVHRCKRIVDGLLDFSRPKPVTKEATDVNVVVEKTLFLLKHHARFRKLQIHRQLDPELGVLVSASAEQLIQVFMALLLNAVDAVADEGSIAIRTRPGRSADEAVIAEVIDDGHGIPRSESSKIFEPFYTTKAPGRGTGLGLSICYAIIADHGGRIEVDSTPGKGSTFRVILPAAEES